MNFLEVWLKYDIKYVQQWKKNTVSKMCSFLGDYRKLVLAMFDYVLNLFRVVSKYRGKNGRTAFQLFDIWNKHFSVLLWYCTNLYASCNKTFFRLGKFDDSWRTPEIIHFYIFFK